MRERVNDKGDGLYKRKTGVDCRNNNSKFSVELIVEKSLQKGLVERVEGIDKGSNTGGFTNSFKHC